MALGVFNRPDPPKFQGSTHHQLVAAMKRNPVWVCVGFVVLIGTIPYSTFLTLQGVWEAQGWQWGPTLLALAIDTAKVSFLGLVALNWATRRRFRELAFACLWAGALAFSLLNSYAAFLLNQVDVERGSITRSEHYQQLSADLA